MVGKWFVALVTVLVGYIVFWAFQQDHAKPQTIAGTTKLIEACKYGDYREATKLIERGADVSEIGLAPYEPYGPDAEPQATAPLNQAIDASVQAEWFYMVKHDLNQEKRVNESLRLVQYLINHRAKPYRGKNSWPILFSTIGQRAFRTLELLIRNGYDPRVRNDKGETLLHHMSMQGQAPYTFEKKFDAMMWFIHVRTLQVLLRSGCPVDVIDNEGRTPLHYASRGGCITMIRVLLAFGADPRHKDDAGITPIDTALDQGTYDMLTGKIDWTVIPELKDY